ncbi:MAG: alanine--tRNA ligase [Desulfobulbaceae bacterium]|jgi:alanyl-tRNA synthetase|nr:alanine--tRNA ligase [Desulfobulbaceae bacterium]
MTGNDIRAKFLEYFTAKHHTLVDSSSLVPEDDPTLLFVNAGMVQFKRIFTGEEKRDYTRATTSQRCVRAGGKHNDLENVGYTARHHTFFEMLGNFSFGDYFKKEAIDFAWEFLVQVLGLDPSKIWVSVFEDDDEAFGLWEDIEDLPKGHIVRLGEKDNFWAMGDTGPCGPCSEIHYDQGAEVGCDDPNCAVGCDCDRWLEVWNLVFMQFERSSDGTLTELPKPSIDTGMGLERIASVVQGVKTNYDSDLFQPLIQTIGTVANCAYGADAKSDVALKVIADHCRTATFLISDGVLPSNEGRGYVLRRVMRRAIRYGRTLGLTKPFMTGICEFVVADMSHAYPHLKTAVELLKQVVENEEIRFLETLDNGLAMLEAEISKVRGQGEKLIDGQFIFKLYDTHGFPVDIVRDMALEVGLDVDDAGFNAAMNEQRAQSRASWRGGDLVVRGAGVKALLEEGLATEFSGYADTRGQTTLLAILTGDGEAVASAKKGDVVSLVCPVTPFYGESGGQTGDAGVILTAGEGAAEISTTLKTGTLFLHKALIREGEFAVGDAITLTVDRKQRHATSCNHTATHLLQAALVQVLGDQVKQSGSLVNQNRLRFDFTNFAPMTPDEIGRVEAIVNDKIRANIPLVTDLLSKDEAIGAGATALFGEKYGEKVRVVSVPGCSKELCGGTHVGATGEIGLVKILSETGIAAGVRRIEAISGAGALAKFQADETKIVALAEMIKATPDDLAEKFAKLLLRQKQLEKELADLHAKLSLGGLDSIIDGATPVNGVNLIAAAIPLDSAKTMREVGDKVRDRMGSGIAVLGGELKGKVSLLAIVSKDLTKQYQAGNIIKEVAAIVGGSGGGRPDMAQAGGTMVDKLPEALKAVVSIVEKMQG